MMQCLRMITNVVSWKDNHDLVNFMMSPLSTLMSVATLCGLVFVASYEPPPMLWTELALPQPAEILTTSLQPATSPELTQLANLDAEQAQPILEN